MNTETKDLASPVLHDEQNRLDERQIRIDKVGVKGLRYPVRVRDKTHDHQDTIGLFNLSVDLPQEFKGTHMSRFLEVLNAHGREIDVMNISDILRELCTKLKSSSSHIEMEFPYFLEKKAPVTGAPGLVDYQVKFAAAMVAGHFELSVTVTVPVATLCPCSKAISERGAHNQRGYVTLTVKMGRKTVWIEDLVRIIEDSASCEIYSVLKRPDEKFVTEKAYDNPVFVEDLVRNVAQRLNAHPDLSWYRVEAENMESIHNHAAYAMIEKS